MTKSNAASIQPHEVSPLRQAAFTEVPPDSSTFGRTRDVTRRRYVPAIGVATMQFDEHATGDPLTIDPRRPVLDVVLALPASAAEPAAWPVLVAFGIQSKRNGQLSPIYHRLGAEETREGPLRLCLPARPRGLLYSVLVLAAVLPHDRHRALTVHVTLAAGPEAITTHRVVDLVTWPKNPLFVSRALSLRSM